MPQEINVRYNSDEGHMLHPGPPQYSIGQAIEITDGDTGDVLACFVEDAWYDSDLNITSYLLTEKPFFVPDLNDLFNRDTDSRN